MEEGYGYVQRKLQESSDFHINVNFDVNFVIQTFSQNSNSKLLKKKTSETEHACFWSVFVEM